MVSLLNLCGMAIIGFAVFGGTDTTSPQFIINLNFSYLQKKEGNMANLHWRGEKAPKETAIELLMAEVVDCTDNRFYVRHASDGTGGHLCIYVETTHTDDPNKFNWKEEPPYKFKGWRVIRIMVPIGYIDGILLAKETDDA